MDFNLSVKLGIITAYLINQLFIYLNIIMSPVLRKQKIFVVTEPTVNGATFR